MRIISNAPKLDSKFHQLRLFDSKLYWFQMCYTATDLNDVQTVNHAHLITHTVNDILVDGHDKG